METRVLPADTTGERPTCTVRDADPAERLAHCLSCHSNSRCHLPPPAIGDTVLGFPDGTIDGSTAPLQGRSCVRIRLTSGHTIAPVWVEPTADPRVWKPAPSVEEFAPPLFEL
jgi:hypothetical protein